MNGPILMIFIVLYLGGLLRSSRGYRNSWICIYLVELLIVFILEQYTGGGAFWAVTLS